MTEAVVDLTFGLEGDAATSQLRGFSYPEPGFTWSVGTDVALRVDLDAGPTPTMIEVELSPFTPGPERPHQRMALRINGVEVAADRIERDGTLGYWIPEKVGIGPSNIVEFTFPDAARPKDFSQNPDPRRLGFKFHRLRLLAVPREPAIAPRRLAPLWADQPVSAGLLPEYEAEVELVCGQSVHDLMFAFENLGWNCEFGLLQRRCGAEPLSLMRFSGIALPNLLKGLPVRFETLDDPQYTYLTVEGQEREFFFRNDNYGVRAHTWRTEGKADSAKVLSDVLRNMRFYLRKFYEDLESAGRMYVFQSPGQILPAHALPLLTALRHFGDCSLLFVCDQPGAPAGTAEQLSPHLFRGCIKTYAPLFDVSQSDLPTWLSVCANAWRLWKGDAVDADTRSSADAGLTEELAYSDI